jgi:uncharacterized protein (DUF58 family)
VRTALSALTTRGRCLLAAGVAAALCSLLLGEKDLLRVACFLIALPLIAAGAVVRTRFRLRCARQVLPGRVQVGQPAEVVLELENVSYLPTGLLLLEDDLPYTLGGRPRFMLDRVRPGTPRRVRYPVRSDVRGRYRVGPLRLRLTDPFGLVELTRSFTATDRLTVVPAVQPLPAVNLSGAWHAGGDSVSRAVAVRGEDDAATREYRHGDDLRKVHWRSTARVGKLMVRREERPWQSTATLLLDSRAAAHRGDGPGSSFEWAVSAAASIGVHLGRLGYTLRLLSDTGPVQRGVDFAEEGALLDHLAEVSFTHRTDLHGAVTALRSGDSHGTLIAVLGAVGVADARALITARPQQDTNIALLVDATTWVGALPRLLTGDRSETDEVAELLLRNGWRVLRATHGALLPQLWPQVGERAGMRSGLVNSGLVDATAIHTGTAETGVPT